MTSSPTLPAFTLTRPQAAPLDPPPLYAQLREEQPITRVSLWEGRLTAWLVTRWEDARAVLGSPAFSSDPAHPAHPPSGKASRRTRAASSRATMTPSMGRCGAP